MMLPFKRRRRLNGEVALAQLQIEVVSLLIDN